MASQERFQLKFAPFRSQIELPFYTNFFKTKLEHSKLDDSALPIVGVYSPTTVEPASSAKMLITSNAMSGKTESLEYVRGEGFIKNVNTLDEFKKHDKTALLQKSGQQIWDAIKDGTIYECPSLLSSFAVLSYADLKKYVFHYWFVFPALHSSTAWKRVGPVEKLATDQSSDLVEKVGTWRYMQDERKRGFFLAKRISVPTYPDDSSTDLDVDATSAGSEPAKPSERLEWQVGSLGDFETGFFRDVAEEGRYVGFVDSATYDEGFSWPLRNLLILIRQRFCMDKARVICYRDNHASRHAARSLVLNLELDPTEHLQMAEMPKVTGWERDSDNNLRPRKAFLDEFLDPRRLADSATDLNLKLMKWRIAPSLDLDAIRNTRCLLLGTGTLGGYVARSLMAWGIRKITFVDYGKVSFSNPVRQPLFSFADCLDGGKPKAACAARAVLDIAPGIDSEGHQFEVPMLGHPVLDEKESKATFEGLRDLFDRHDAVFLLMDTRESRWLPTVMGKAAGKIVMNAALGFDSYVAMRHGAELEDKAATTLGCYFCNDVVAPGDSTKDLTLDQQCTVSRPEVAQEASAKVVGLFVSLLQHPLGQRAPAPKPAARDAVTERDPPSHPLGLVPHQIRGDLANFETIRLRGESYPSCSACSPTILEAYRRDGWEFVQRALNERNYVAELSGLAEVQRRAEELSKQWADEEDEDDGGDDGVMI